MVTFNADQIVSVVNHDTHVNTEWTYHPPKKKFFGGMAEEFWTNIFYAYSGDKYSREDIAKKDELFIVDNTVYSKAEVLIQFSGDKTIVKKYYFISNIEAKDFHTRIAGMIPNKF